MRRCIQQKLHHAGPLKSLDWDLKRQPGFTLIELVIVIVVAGILSAVIAPIVMKPFLAYEDTSRRVALVDAAESALRKIARDVRNAIPNTLRTNGSVLELMPIQGGGRYRYSDNASDNTALTPGATDDQFRMLGKMSSMPPVEARRLVVHNTGSTQFYAAATTGGLGIITPSSTTITISPVDSANETSIRLSSGFQFDPIANGSPRKRFYIATSPLTYHCDIASGTIVRYQGYATSLTQPVNRNVAPLNAATDVGLLVNHVSACDFTYSPGSNSRSGLLIVKLTLTIDGDFINLLHQIHTANAP